MKKQLAAVTLLALGLSAGCAMFKKNPDPVTFNKLTSAQMPKMALATAKTKKKSLTRGPASSDGRLPNSTRYSSNSVKPETGRSGGRTLSSLALMNAQGQTSLRVATADAWRGQAEEGTSFSKLQVKSVNEAGETVLNKEYNNLAENNGVMTLALDGLTRYQPLAVQANIKKTGLNRNFVVSTSNKVYLLPDPSVVSLDAPEEVVLGDMVNLQAHVRELNGDVGANADCVLYIDGTESERAPGIWVDAGDTVICNFDLSFSSVGTRNLRVAVENVSPEDYNGGNNSAARDITVIEAVKPIQGGYINFLAFDQVYFYRFQYPGYYGGSYNRDLAYQATQFQGYVNELITTPTVDVAISESLDNLTSTHSGTVSLSNDVCTDPVVQCYRYDDYTNNIHYQISVYPYHNQTRFYSWRAHNRAVYWGATGVYSYLNGRVEASGGSSMILPSQGSQFVMNVDLNTGNGGYRTSMTRQVVPYNYTYNFPWTCGQYGPYCYEYRDTRTGIQYNGF